MPNLFNNQYANLASKGRFGDTMLAHINPQEAGLLTAMGGSGTINPQTGLPEFYGFGGFTSFPQRVEEPLPSLGQALDPASLANLTTQLNTTTVPTEYRGLQGSIPGYEKVNPEYSQYADRDLAQVRTGANIEGYTIPTDKTFQNIPLVAQYDTQGNFKHLTLEPGQYLYPDPNQPNIVSAPRINAKGEIIDYGIGDLNEFNSSGGFGGFVKDFGPMILAGLGANYLAGSGLFTSAGAAAGGATAAEIAASNALAAANTAGYAGTSLASTAAGAAGAAAGTGLLNSGATAAGGSGATSPFVSQAAGAYGAGGAAATTTASTIASQIATQGATPSLIEQAAKFLNISPETLKTFAPSAIQGLLSTAGSVLTADKATEAAKIQSDAQIRAAQIAADAARFRPVGVTTRFGSSKFKTDAAGNVIEAGYTPSAEITGYQNRLSTLANQGLTDVEGARAAYQPLTGAAQNLFSLGKSYLAKTPEEAAQDYIAKQTALLAPSRENQLAELRNRQFQTGRGGVAVSQGGNLMATSPELAAYYNSLAQSDLALAAQADEEARRRISYGAGLFDTGANLQGRYYTGQTGAYAPFTTAMDTSSGLESLAQVPLTLSTQIGAKTTASAADVGRLTSQGITSAAQTMAPANAYSAAGNVFTGAAQSPVFANAVNRSFGNTQQSTQQQYTYDPVSKQFIPVQSSSVFV